MDCRYLVLVLRLNDHNLVQTCTLIDIYLICDVLDYRLEFNLTGNLGYDNGVEWVPSSNYLALLDNIVLACIELRTVRYVV